MLTFINVQWQGLSCFVRLHCAIEIETFPTQQCCKLPQNLLYDKLGERVIIRYRIVGPFSHPRLVFRKPSWKEDCASDLVSAVISKDIVLCK